MAKISQTSAFKLCEDGKCDDPKEGVAEKIECKPGDKCKAKGCYCQLFQRDKTAKDDDPWDVTPTDGAHEAKKKAEFVYTCLCVQPICLPAIPFAIPRFANWPILKTQWTRHKWNAP